MGVSKSNIKTKNRLFIGVLCLILLPLFLDVTGLIKIKPLNGAYSVPSNPEFTLSKWFEGDYQEEKENYIGKNLYIRPVFVRLYNQYYYSLFNIPKANSVIIGKSSYLYEKNYIKEYLGRNFIGSEKIKEKVVKLARVADTLRTKGVELIVVFAPGKGSFYPDFIPDEFNPGHKTITNYEVYNNELMKSEIHYLDFNRWFVNNKSTSEYPLFPKTGIHWSKYGELLAADSIIKYINSISQYKKVPELILGEIETSSRMRDTDDDIEKGMNLMFNIPDLEMAYPDYSFKEEKSSNQPKVLTIADSYYWGMFNWGLSQKAFNKGQFWYYNAAIYPDSYDEPINVSDINIVDEVEKNEVVLLMSTDANLYKFAFGFIDQLHEAYFPTVGQLE
ncbi:alginate O-acetyltransferase AlgX-related protein [Brumimicrobium oceani]|uniref:AlgX/AlgJ SGNH hydrolase-like domain-containing protein n=1 Tax=Brumimicrobium oceani TaxID=2100725 RepID=A0A2U2XFI8_9FLAO|nr:hypothetical protein [Brumimicrobium oceani]PWH86555.1 hypothetical protein DIT68_04790 [Brumimicrobium oceani]